MNKSTSGRCSVVSIASILFAVNIPDVPWCIGRTQPAYHRLKASHLHRLVEPSGQSQQAPVKHRLQENSMTKQYSRTGSLNNKCCAEQCTCSIVDSRSTESTSFTDSGQHAVGSCFLSTSIRNDVCTIPSPDSLLNCSADGIDLITDGTSIYTC